MNALLPGAVVLELDDPDVRGVVLESPAVDPDGIVWPCHVVVRWPDGTIEILPASWLQAVNQ